MGDHEQQADDVGLSDDLELDGEQADGVKGGAALVLDGVAGESKGVDLTKEIKLAK
jgi:hypothetical protein